MKELNKKHCKLIWVLKSLDIHKTLEEVESYVANLPVEKSVSEEVKQRQDNLRKIRWVLEELKRQDIRESIFSDDIKDNPYPNKYEEEIDRMNKVKEEIKNFDIENYRQEIRKYKG